MFFLVLGYVIVIFYNESILLCIGGIVGKGREGSSVRLNGSWVF